MTAVRREVAPGTSLSVPPWLVPLLLVVVAFVLRGRYFGIPDIFIDEEFYLLVGDRVASHGAIPYVDIWDRKPVGLFLLYAAIRLLGGDGIIQYQVVATLFAAATACVIAIWVRRLAGSFAALAAGVFYLVLPHRLSGQGGQSEIFLNLFVVTAAYIIACRIPPLRDPDEGSAGRKLLWYGMAAMLLSGVAIQIKTTAVFPGVFLGLTLICLAWRASWPLTKIAAATVFWALGGLFPSLIAVGWYAASGHLDAFMFANVWSMSLKESEPIHIMLDRFRSQLLRIGLPTAGCLALTAVQQWRRAPDRPPQPMLVFMLGWLASGFIAFVSVGHFYPYYALIVTTMTCVLFGTLARPRGLGWLAIAGMLVFSALILRLDQQQLTRQRSTSASIYALADTIRANLDGGCLYIYRGPQILYHLTRTCLPTRYAFQNHLNTIQEARALGIDAGHEVRRILALPPAVIVYSSANRYNDDNAAASAQVRAALASRYSLIATLGPPGPDQLGAYRLKGP